MGSEKKYAITSHQFLGLKPAEIENSMNPDKKNHG